MNLERVGLIWANTRSRHSLSLPTPSLEIVNVESYRSKVEMSLLPGPVLDIILHGGGGRLENGTTLRTDLQDRIVRHWSTGDK
jgi:hypothetical protein